MKIYFCKLKARSRRQWTILGHWWLKKKQFESNHATHLMQFKRWATFLLYSSKYGSHSLFSRDQWNGAHQWHVVDQSVENILSSFPRVVQLAQVQTHLGGQLAKRSPGQSVVEFSVWRDSDWDNVTDSQWDILGVSSRDLWQQVVVGQNFADQILGKRSWRHLYKQSIFFRSWDIQNPWDHK